MANVADVKQHIDPVTIELGGKTRTLQFDMNAFAELEKRFGSVDAAMEGLSKGRLSDVRMILWAALIHEEVAEFDEDTGEPIKYNITPYEVGKFVKNLGMLKEVSEKLGQAITSGMTAEDLENMPEDVRAELEAAGLNVGNDAAKN